MLPIGRSGSMSKRANGSGRPSGVIRRFWNRARMALSVCASMPSSCQYDQISSTASGAVRCERRMPYALRGTAPGGLSGMSASRSRMMRRYGSTAVGGVSSLSAT